MITEDTVALTFASRIEAIAEAADSVARLAGRFGYDEAAIFGIDMAVREAVTNAVLHGNKEDAQKPVELIFAHKPETLTITVRDRGTGFDPASVPDPTNTENLLKTSGRGILFMRNFMDEVEWTIHPEGGTVVRMTKNRAAS
jgi:serine/threonine-protein kinase RsbW